MHILLIHQSFIDMDEAGGTRHIEMARRLAAKGHRVTIITGTASYLTGVERRPGMRGSETRQAGPGITVLHCWTYAAWHRGFFHRLLSFFSFMFSSFLTGLRVREVDVFWATSPPIFQAFTSWLLAFLKRRPFLFEVRDLWPDFAVAMGVLRSPVLIALSRWLERFLYRRARLVVVNSPGFIGHVQARGARRIELVPNGVDAAMFAPLPEEEAQAARSELGLQDRFLVVYAGAHGPANDLGLVLAAAGLLRAHPNIHFLLVGDGKDKPVLQQAARDAGLDQVTFMAPVPKSQMRRVLGAAHACLAVLKPLEMYKTTYPNKVFDYMAAGKPVLLAIDGVIRAVVEQAGAGVFVPPGSPQALAEAVLQLCRRPEAGAQMGAAGRNYVLQHFDRSRLTDRFEALLCEISRGR